MRTKKPNKEEKAILQCIYKGGDKIDLALIDIEKVTGQSVQTIIERSIMDYHLKITNKEQANDN